MGGNTKRQCSWKVQGGQKLRRSGFIYIFFLVHMLGFGLSGFVMAYSDNPPGLAFLYLHGGFAIFVYLVFYLAIFGLDQVRWMFINAGLGLFGIYAQIDWILSLFGKTVRDFSVWVHIIPFLYYVLYTFLLYQFVLHLARVPDHPERKKAVETIYVLGSLAVYSAMYLSQS